MPHFQRFSAPTKGTSCAEISPRVHEEHGAGVDDLQRTNCILCTLVWYVTSQEADDELSTFWTQGWQDTPHYQGDIGDTNSLSKLFGVISVVGLTCARKTDRYDCPRLLRELIPQKFAACGCAWIVSAMLVAKILSQVIFWGFLWLTASDRIMTEWSPAQLCLHRDGNDCRATSEWQRFIVLQWSLYSSGLGGKLTML